MSVIRSSRSEGTGITTPHNMGNVPDLHNKVQTSYLIEATISEIRPGGDVILATPQGLLRTNASIPLEEGDKVLTRLTTDQDGDVKVHIISKANSESAIDKIDKFGIELLNKYILQNIGISSKGTYDTGQLKARVSYVAANKNTLKYGNIKPGDEITIQMLPPKSLAAGTNVIVGEVLGNSHNSIILNSSIGMLNINAKSTLSMGDKVLFKVVGVPDEFEQTLIKASIEKLITDISENKLYLKALLNERLNIDNNEHYTRFLHLISSVGAHNITLARLFHNTKNIQPNDVERWIDQDIVEPFEASAKSSVFETLAEDITTLTKQFVELKIIPDRNVWQIVEMPIPGTNEHASMRVRREKEQLIEFIIDLNHESFGRMLIQGSLELPKAQGEFHNLNITLRHSDSFPASLRDSIASSFAMHKSLSTMNGEIKFEAMDMA